MEKILALENLPTFTDIHKRFFEGNSEALFKKFYDSNVPNKELLPNPYQSELTQFQKLLLLKSLREDKMEGAIQ